MLIFYLQTRPTKTQKAGVLLLMRAQNYAAKDNIGNLFVTIGILHEMVRKLNKHLNLFAVQALNIINIVIEKSFGPEATFVEEASNLFKDFNKYHDGVLFSGHSSYAQEFLATTAKFAKVARAKVPHSAVHALDALDSLGSSPALATRTGQQALQIAMHGLEANLPTSDPDMFDAELDGKDPHEGTQKEISRKAIAGVQAFVDTTSLEQITRIISSVMDWLGMSEGEWQQKLLVNIAKWVPPQNRFIVTKTLVNEMSKLQVAEVKQERIYTTYLNALLRADESKIGLSAVDVQHQLISLQHRLITRTPEAVDNQSIQDLIVRLRSNIGSLSAINIYPGQVSGMVGDILSKYVAPSPGFAPQRSAPSADTNGVSSGSNGKTSTSFSDERPIGVVLNDLYDIREILSAAPRQQKLTLDCWVNTQWLLASQASQLLTFYALTFMDYVKVAVRVESPASKRGSLIVRQLCQVLLDPETPKEPMNYIAIYYCLVAYIERLQQEAYSVLPWICKLSPQQADYEVPEKNFCNVCLSSVTLACLLAIARTVGAEDASAKLLEVVTQRVKEKTWLPGIVYPTLVPIERSIGIAAKAAKPTFAELNHSDLDLRALGLSSKEVDAVLHPDFDLEEPLNQDEYPVYKVRAHSISELSNGSSSRRVSGRSLVSLDQGQAPKVAELRRRQTDTQSLRAVGLKNNEPQPPAANHRSISVKPSGNSPDGPANAASVASSPAKSGPIVHSSSDLLNVLESVGIDDFSGKGRLTV